METARSLIALILVTSSLGCIGDAKSLRKAPHEVLQSVGLENPAPAVRADCVWQRRPAALPDPTRDGAQTMGLVGQLFLTTSENQPAEIAGDLAIAVYDETPRSAGVAAKKSELWHYDRDTLKRLAAVDDRFGKCVVLYLPLPDDWRDVNTVRIVARYQCAGLADIYTREVRMALDRGNGNEPRVTFDTRTVPDAGKYLKELRDGKSFPAVPPAHPEPVVPTAATQPPVMPPLPDPKAPLQPIIIARPGS